MKKAYSLLLVLVVSVVFLSCSSDDNTPVSTEVTMDKFLGKWEHYATKSTKYNNEGEFIIIGNVNDLDLDDPCYESFMEFKTHDLIFSGTLYEDGNYDCNLSASWSTKWWHDEGKDYFIFITEFDDETYQDRYYFYFDNQGNMILWESGYSETLSWFYRKVN